MHTLHRLKDFRRHTSRDDQLAFNYASAVAPTAIIAIIAIIAFRC